jgi:hypothetical protein
VNGNRNPSNLRVSAQSSDFRTVLAPRLLSFARRSGHPKASRVADPVVLTVSLAQSGVTRARAAF